MIREIGFVSSYPAIMDSNKIFNTKGENDLFEPFNILKQKLSSKKISINTIDLIDNFKKLDLLIVSRHENNIHKLFDIIKLNPTIKILLISTEEISVALTQAKNLLEIGLFDRILTWRDDDIDGDLFFKYNYWNPHREYQFNPQKSRKLLCLINSYKKNYYRSKHNIYSKRFELIEFFNSRQEFDLFGHGWLKYKKKLKCYKGSVENKIEIYQNYDFAFIFENSNNEKGGISEKLWDAFAAGCIPIYYGAPNILDYIPLDCFIDFRNFSDLKALLVFLKNMSVSEKRNKRKAIKKFMSSKEYENFTSEGFCRTMIRNINQLGKLKSTKKNILKIKFIFIKKLIINRISILKHKRLYYNLLISKNF